MVDHTTILCVTQIDHKLKNVEHTSRGMPVSKLSTLSALKNTIFIMSSRVSVSRSSSTLSFSGETVHLNFQINPQGALCPKPFYESLAALKKEQIRVLAREMGEVISTLEENPHKARGKPPALCNLPIEVNAAGNLNVESFIVTVLSLSKAQLQNLIQSWRRAIWVIEAFKYDHRPAVEVQDLNPDSFSHEELLQTVEKQMLSDQPKDLGFFDRTDPKFLADMLISKVAADQMAEELEEIYEVETLRKRMMRI